MRLRAVALSDSVVAALLAGLILLTILATRPLADVPLNDDFSYARSAQALAETGRIVYNGWGSPLLLPQLAWGALLIKAGGFSWNLLAASGIVFAALAAATMYRLARACTGSPLWSVLATAALTLNPIFLGVAPSFMSDIPTLFLLLLSLLLLVRSLSSDAAEGPVVVNTGGFLASVVLGIIAGSNRQLCWAIYLGALLPLIVLLPRSRWFTLPAAGAVLVVAILLSAWFSRQPYTVPADITPGLLMLVGYTGIAVMFTYKFLNMLGLFLFPFAVASPGTRRLKPLTVAALLVLSGLPLFYHFGTTLNPLDGNYYLTIYGQYLTSSGVQVGGVSGFSERPRMLPAPVAQTFALFGAAGLAALLCHLAGLAKELRQARETRLTRGQLTVAVVTTASVVGVAASVPWFAQINVFDRYLLLFLPGLLILFAARASAQKPPRWATGLTVSLVAGMALLGFVFVSEYMNYTRARAGAYRFLLGRGVDPRAIEGGFEFNADTQIRAGGYINNSAIVHPPGAFRSDAKAPHVEYRPELFPALDPHYLLTTREHPGPALVWPEPIHRTNYFSIVPPQRRAIYIYRIRR